MDIHLRSQWPRGLRHVKFSAAQTLRSRVWIPLGAWMCVSAFFCIVLPCVGRRLASGWSPVEGVLQSVLRFIKFRSWILNRNRPWMAYTLKDDDDDDDDVDTQWMWGWPEVGQMHHLSMVTFVVMMQVRDLNSLVHPTSLLQINFCLYDVITWTLSARVLPVLLNVFGSVIYALSFESRLVQWVIHEISWCMMFDSTIRFQFQ
jgi:hypothetical protein